MKQLDSVRGVLSHFSQILKLMPLNLFKNTKHVEKCEETRKNKQDVDYRNQKGIKKHSETAGIWGLTMETAGGGAKGSNFVLKCCSKSK